MSIKNLGCLKLDEVKSWKNRFNERLRDVSEVSDFKDFLEDERLQTFLNTEMKDLVKITNSLGFSYKYLIEEDFWDSDMNLKEFLEKFYSQISDLSRLKLKVFVSEDKIINGLVMFCVMNSPFLSHHRIITNLNFMSFDLSKNNVVLIKDIYNLLSNLLKDYDYIEWGCYTDNPACDAYKKFCDKFGGEYSVVGKKMRFTLIGNNERFENKMSELKIIELKESLIEELIN